MDPEGQPTARVEQLWFSPDTIIIRAENKLFQVSQGILAARSTVFRDMIGFPQPTSDDNELINGRPVVRLHDSADDVTAFLIAIFDSRHVKSHLKLRVAPDLNVHLAILCRIPPQSSLLGILRLANKSDVPHLFRRALEHLTLAGWYTETCDGVHDCDSQLITPPNATAAEALAISAAAAEVGAQWLLPWGYYTAATFAGREVLPLMDDERLVQHARKCLDAHVHMVRGTAAVNQFLVAAPPGCLSASACSDLRRDELSAFFISVKDRKDQDPIYDSTEVVVRKLRTKGLCDVCCTFAEGRRKASVAVFWETLPSVFELPPWEELRAMKVAAMGPNEDTGGNAAA
ncbi:hypothetical protein B0H17DRAFT_1338561 [Mycena rosella]|uniref:BTB domain-containing protein n=1 Tax=Mycena rosella TaxID=1033263 RepID=A0AAD7CP69_MYCRO|nr:hypothetical protein B0H17DRAFT_1338561 [Mycena rosella]